MKLSGAPILAATASLALFLAGVLAFEALRADGRELPASADVRELRCTYATPEGQAMIYATIRNSTDEPRDYEVRVDFETRADARVGSGVIVVRGAKPGQDVSVQATGEFVPGSVPVRCVVA